METTPEKFGPDPVRELMLRRRNQRRHGEDGRFLSTGNTLADQVSAYLRTYKVGKIDQMARDLGRSEVDVRRAVYTLRQDGALTGIQTIQTSDDSGIYFLEHPDPRGLVIRNARGVKRMGIDHRKAITTDPSERLEVMHELGIVEGGTLLSGILSHLAEGPHTSRDLKQKLNRDTLNVAELLRASVHRKLLLCGLSVQKNDVGKSMGIGRLTALHLDAIEVPWDISQESFQAENEVRDFFQKFWNKFFSFLLPRLQDEQESQDTLQNVFMHFLYLARTEPLEVHRCLNFQYVYEMLRNGLKRKKRDSTRGVRKKEYNDALLLPQNLRVEPTAERELETDELHEILTEALQHPFLASYREALELYYFYDMDHTAIAERVGVKPRNVYSQLSRGRQILREILEDKKDDL